MQMLPIQGARLYIIDTRKKQGRVLRARSVRLGVRELGILGNFWKRAIISN